MFSIAERFHGYVERTLARRFGCRWTKINVSTPIISFSFDDFPRSALTVAGSLLEKHGARGTYYLSMGLMDGNGPTGEIFRKEDLKTLVQTGHELGCHTFAHYHAWKTRPSVFESSIRDNAEALQQLVPGAMLPTLSYPIGSPRPGTKRRAARHFECCRGGGQSVNHSVVDANYLTAFFLEQSRSDPEAIKQIIAACCRDSGWLIFATHDVSDRPTPYGCTPSLFEEVVKYSISSGASILPVSQAWRRVSASPQ